MCMKFLTTTLVKSKLFPALAICTATAFVSVPAVATANNSESQIHLDQDYHANVDKARNMLQARGYQVSKISADDKQGQKALQISAKKNGYDWDIRLSYPALKILQERRGE